MTIFGFILLILAFIGVFLIGCLTVRGFKAWRHDKAELDKKWEQEYRSKLDSEERKFTDKVKLMLKHEMGIDQMKAKIDDLYSAMNPRWSPNGNALKDHEERLNAIGKATKELRGQIHEVHRLLKPYA